MADGDDQRIANATRRLMRASAILRILGLIAMIGAGLTIVVACAAAKSSDDRLGFTLVGLLVLVFGSLFWSTGAFHGAIAEALPALDRKIDKLAELLGNTIANEEREAEPTAVIAESVAAEEIEAVPLAPPLPAPEPERIPCPLCGGLIHPDATRCVHCMRKLPH